MGGVLGSVGLAMYLLDRKSGEMSKTVFHKDQIRHESSNRPSSVQRFSASWTSPKTTVPSGLKSPDLSKPQPLPFAEWVKIARWTYAVEQNKLTGLGFETPELHWQMGIPAEEERAANDKQGEEMRELLFGKQEKQEDDWQKKD